MKMIWRYVLKALPLQSWQIPGKYWHDLLSVEILAIFDPSLGLHETACQEGHLEVVLTTFPCIPLP